METSFQEQPAGLGPISLVNRVQTRGRAFWASLSKGTGVSSNAEQRLRSAVVLIVLGLVLYRVSTFERDYLYSLMVDDAYISARHAQNLVAGHGLNFNADERVEGYTNFLFTLLMALPQLFGGAVEPFIRALGAVTIFAVLGLTYRLARSIAGPIIALLLVAGLALDQRFVFFSIWGLETGFASLPCLAGYALLFSSRYRAAGLAFTAAAMTRIDMVVAIYPAFLYAAFQPSESTQDGDLGATRFERALRLALARPALTRLCATFAGAFGGYFLIRWNYYGWLLPNTFYAKVGEPGDSWRRGLAYVQECFSKMGITALALFAVVAWLACFVRLALSRERHPRAWPEGFRRAIVFLVAAGSYLAYVIAVGGDHFKERFIYHAFPIVLLACVAPFWWLTELSPPERPALRRVAALPVVGFALTLATTLALHPHRFNRADGIAAWVSLGKYLKDVASPGAVLATDAAGAIPYYSELKSIDILGLADLHTGHMEVAKLGSGPAGHEKLDRAYVLGRKPDYISTWFGKDGLAARGFGRDPEFNQQYRLAALVRTDGSEVTKDRVLSISDPEPARSELLALRAGDGNAPGRYEWALYERRRPDGFAPLATSGFRSNLPGWKRSDEYIVAAKKGHAPTHIMWGPFVKLPRGSYSGYVKLELGDLTGLDARQRLCGFDVYDGKRSLVDVSLLVGLSPTAARRNLHFKFDVLPENEQARLEFRMYCLGLTDVAIESVHISAGQ